MCVCVCVCVGGWEERGIKHFIMHGGDRANGIAGFIQASSQKAL